MKTACVGSGYLCARLALPPESSFLGGSCPTAHMADPDRLSRHLGSESEWERSLCPFDCEAFYRKALRSWTAWSSSSPELAKGSGSSSNRAGTGTGQRDGSCGPVSRVGNQGRPLPPSRCQAATGHTILICFSSTHQTHTEPLRVAGDF